MPELPKYRLRLFLSADLVGSTAYKADKTNQVLENGSITPKWVSVFKDFYSAFPRSVKTEYSAGEATLEALEKEHFPVIWKTIGDELILCSRVLNIEHLAYSVSSFIRALGAYSHELKGKSGGKLDIKGNAWVAACPVPNIGYEIVRSEGVGVRDLVTSEDIEIEIDREPYRFDFLGKAIDTGFRISRNSTAARCTISVQLAYLLALAKTDMLFNFELDFDGRAELKGVNDNIPYPILFIDTERDKARRTLRDREKTISGKNMVTPLNLKDFLETFMQVASIERPYITKRDAALASDDMPETFKNFTKVFNQNLEEILKKDEAMLAGEEDPGIGDGEIDPSGLDGIPDVIPEEPTE